MISDHEQIKWQLGLIVFRAVTSALHIPGVNRREIAKAFLLAAETLVADSEIAVDGG